MHFSCSGQRRLTVYFQHTILRLMLRIYREDELDVLAFLPPQLPLAHSLDLSHILYRAYFPLAFPSSEQIQCKISYTITALNLLNCRRTMKNTLSIRLS